MPPEKEQRYNFSEPRLLYVPFKRLFNGTIVLENNRTIFGEDLTAYTITKQGTTILHKHKYIEMENRIGKKIKLYEYECKDRKFLVALIVSDYLTEKEYEKCIKENKYPIEEVK